MKILLYMCCILLPFVVRAQDITTIVSSGVGNINGVAFDSHGNLFFTTLLGNQIKKLDTNGIISLVAGTGFAGFFGDGGLATNANLSTPVGIAIDTADNVFFTDADNQRIRRIDKTTGIISTIAGIGPGGSASGGFFGDGGQATAAELNEPDGICIDKYNNIFFSDYKNYRVRKINSSGLINTIAGCGLIGSEGDGGTATSAKCNPSTGLAIDNIGNLYFTQALPTIRKIDPTGNISTIAGDTISNAYNGDEIPATNAQLDAQWLAIGNDGQLYISDEANNARIRRIDNAGVIHTIAGIGVNGNTGNGGPATAAEVSPTGLAFDNCNNLVFGETWTADIRKITFHPDCWSSKVPQIPSSELTVYPNPVLETLYIDNVKTNTKYALFNITGIMITNRTLTGGSNTISLAGLAAGVYVVKIWDSDGVETVRRVVKW